jgi:hypothetical protein
MSLVSYANQGSQFVGAIKSNDQIVPAYVTTGFNFIYGKSSFILNRQDGGDLKFSDDLGFNKSGAFTEWYISGNAGSFSTRYYYMFPKVFSGSGTLKNSLIQVVVPSATIPAITTTKAIIETSLVDATGAFSSSRIEVGFPFYFARLGVVLEPFVVGEWNKKDFSLTTATTPTTVSTGLSALASQINTSRSSLIGPGIVYRQVISKNLDLSFKFFKACSDLDSSLTFMDVKTNWFFQDGYAHGFFAGGGYNYRNYNLGHTSGRFHSVISGPYLEVGFNF